MSVTVNINESVLTVHSPYNPDFPARAKRLGGKWNAGAKAWTFDTRDEERVRALCRKVYGEDGSPIAETVTVRVTVNQEWYVYGGGLYLMGRELCYARGRDSGAKLGPGVVLLAGEVLSGGSVKNWRTLARADAAVSWLERLADRISYPEYRS